MMNAGEYRSSIKVKDHGRLGSMVPQLPLWDGVE